ncbi:restriction endonuclease subunit M [Methylobacter sp.]|uniref:restriction endonuclease subunit M n=1 Tax=Methylobacter sp. TaxID=2051955 RepID=UPI003DA5C9C9
MQLIEQGKTNGLIAFSDDGKTITYLNQNKKRNYTNAEEQVQAETFLKLVLKYGYPVERIRQFVSVTMGSSTKEADIIVYHDDACLSPYIIVECKNQDVSEQEFKQAGDQAFSYAYALAGTTKFIWVTKGNKEEFYRFDKDKNKKNTENDIPYFGESDTKKYKYAKGGFYTDKVKGQDTRIKTDDVRPVAESELTRIFKQAHDALWAGGELNPSQAFDELDKLIFCKVWDEKNTDEGEPYQFQIVSEYPNDENKNLESLKKRIVAIYEKGKNYDPEIFNKPIDLTAERIKSIVEYFQSVSFSETDLDSKGKAFETFLGTYFRGEFGQFFTPRNVVKFAVDVLPITHESKVLDTSCGSGGFLLYCLDKVRKQADLKFDVSDPKKAIAHYNRWHGFAANNLFGIEINDQISRVAKMNMIIHDDGHTNVITFDGLYQIDYISKNCNGGKGNAGFAENSFDFIVTNPPFGSIIKQSEKAYMQSDGHTAPYYDFSLKELNWIDAKIKDKHTTTGRENQSTEVLFIEQCHRFLKVGGYLAIVIPDGILTNSSSQYVRDGIEEKFRIVGVVSLPQTAFTNTGAGVKSSVLFLKKHDPETTKSIRETKQSLQVDLIQKNQLISMVNAWEKEKQALLKPLKAKDEETKARRQAINDEYNDKLNALKEELEEYYQQEKQARLLDYPIFMAIAEYIGYDATGRTISQNDLPKITEELRRFIGAIEAGQDSFF